MCGGPCLGEALDMLGGASMGLRALHFSPAPDGFTAQKNLSNHRPNKISTIRVSAKKEEQEPPKQSLFSSVTEALDFSQVRSKEDAQLLEDAREATRSGGMISREQYGALRRKIGGPYKDFFKSYIDVDGQYVEGRGWTGRARFARKTRGANQGKWTSLEDMLM